MRPARDPAGRPAGRLTGRPAGKPFRLYGYALLISFTGSLPVGTLNVSITDLVIDRRVGAAILFGMGAMLVEVGLVRIALVTVQLLEGMSGLLRWFRLLACIVILSFAYISLEAAWHVEKVRVADPFIGNAPFVSGLILSLLNPLHLPFWMGWTAVLRSKGLLCNTRREYNVYVLAIGMGTGMAFLVYGIAGHLLILFLRMNQNLINWLSGIALLVAGLVQVWKLGAGRIGVGKRKNLQG